jgi:threonine/homoserine/homoserine lactone efflux protein
MSLSIFFLASVALALTPGADMLYVTARAAAGGRTAGVASSLGIAVGALGHTAAAALGVSALLASSAAAFGAVKWIGAFYLVYLGIKILRSDAPSLGGAQKRESHRAVFLQGVAVNALNPKVTLFFLAFLPQFVDPSAGDAWLQILLLGFAFNAMGTSVNLAVAFAAGSVPRVVRPDAKLPRRIRRLSGAVLVGMGAALALAKR